MRIFLAVMMLAVTGPAALLPGVVRAESADTALFSEPWVRAAPPGARMLAAYLRIENAGAAPLKLVAASSEDFGLVEFHRSETVDGVSRMRQVEVLEIAPGQSLELAPGGLHLMLMRPARALAEGESTRIRFVDEAGVEYPVQFPVRRSAAGGPPATAPDEGHRHH